MRKKIQTGHGKKKETKFVSFCHKEERDKFIKQFGEEEFNLMTQTDERYKNLESVPIPEGYDWVWSIFLDIWRNCERDMAGNVIFTTRSLIDYEECYETKIGVYNKRILMKMKQWALETICSLEKEEDT